MTVAFAVLIDAAGSGETGGGAAAAAAAHEEEMVFAEEPRPFVDHIEACRHPDDQKRATEMAAVGVVAVPTFAAAEMDTHKEEAEPYRQTWTGWIVGASCQVAYPEAF
jgi:predicted dinucleotide-binding enzyme